MGFLEPEGVLGAPRERLFGEIEFDLAPGHLNIIVTRRVHHQFEHPVVDLVTRPR